jgi:hypothetical protein
MPMMIWSLILGPSGDRKSTAISKAWEVAEPILGEQRAGIGASPEATFDLVTHVPDTFFCYPEGKGFFSLFNARYWEHGQGIFLELYDGKRMKRQLTAIRDKKKNASPKPIEIIIERPRTSLVIGIALDHLDRTRNEDWTGGLIGRMMLVYDVRTRYEDIELENPPLRDMMSAELHLIRQQLVQYKQKHGQDMPIGMKTAAFDMHREWARKLDQAMKRKPPKVRAIYNRLPNHVLRVAGNYAISQFHSSIGVSSMEPAIVYGNRVAESCDVCADQLADDKSVRNSMQILEALEPYNTSPVSMRIVCRALRKSSQTLWPAVRSLVDQGVLAFIKHQIDGEVFLRKLDPQE